MATEGCKHEKCQPAFDEERAKSMTVEEVRKEFPRFFGNCPDCGTQVISYASRAHYVFGDW